MAGDSASEDARERAYVPAIHILVAKRRGCPAQGRAWRSKPADHAWYWQWGGSPRI